MASGRVFLGALLLLCVDLLWVGSSELTEFIFKQQEFDKPFFTTFFKSSLFSLYLVGFLFWSPWHRRCCGSRHRDSGGDSPLLVESDPDDPSSHFEPINAGSESEVESENRRVHFNKLAEVRPHFGSRGARRSAGAAGAGRSDSEPVCCPGAACHFPGADGRLSVSSTMRISATFCILWFSGNYAYQMALRYSQAAIVNILSSSSSFFTLLMAAVLPSGAADRLTLSKCCAVALSLGGVALVFWQDLIDRSQDARSTSALPLGALFGLVSAALYASYLVTLRYRVPDDASLDFPMFFGFVGLFNILLLWPGFAIVQWLNLESLTWPNNEQLLLLLANGLVGTVLSELLWLWGCYLTSSLTGTLSLSLTIPLSVFADKLFRPRVDTRLYDWHLYAGAVPVFVAFLLVAILQHCGNPDPVLDMIRTVFCCGCQPSTAVDPSVQQPPSTTTSSRSRRPRHDYKSGDGDEHECLLSDDNQSPSPYHGLTPPGLPAAEQLSLSTATA